MKSTSINGMWENFNAIENKKSMHNQIFPNNIWTTQQRIHC
jgi:hypothetical protein